MSLFKSSMGSSFRPDKLHNLDEYKKESLMKIWSLDETTFRDNNLSFAFSYYQILEMLCGFKVESILHSDSIDIYSSVSNNGNSTDLTKERKGQKALDARKEMIEKIKYQQNKYFKYWRDRSQRSLVSTEESLEFPFYFASIEVVVEDKLIPVYFPIPRVCRRQMLNRIVRNEMDQVMENVNRNTPEEKIDSFIDLSIQVTTALKFHNSLESPGIVFAILRFLERNEPLWYRTIFCITFYINLMLLLNGEKHHGWQDGYSKQQLYEYGNSSDPSFFNQTIWVDTSHPGRDYLSQNLYDQLHILAYVHVALSVLLFLSYLCGTGAVSVYKGLSWRNNVKEGLVTLSFGGVMEQLYQIADKTLPDFVWAFGFLIRDPLTIYNIVFVLMSVLGMTQSLAYFVFHLIDIIYRIKQMSYVISAVFRNYDQLISTLMLAGIIIWVYVVIGSYYFRFESYNFTESVPSPTTLWGAYAQHLDFGLTHAPS